MALCNWPYFVDLVDVSAIMLEGVIVGMAACMIFREAERVSGARGRGREACMSGERCETVRLES